MCAQDVEIGVGGSRNRERVGEIRRENGREGGRTGDRANSNDLQYRVAIQ